MSSVIFWSMLSGLFLQPDEGPTIIRVNTPDLNKTISFKH